MRAACKCVRDVPYSQHSALTPALREDAPKLDVLVSASSNSSSSAIAHLQERAKQSSHAAATAGGSRNAHLDPRVLLVLCPCPRCARLALGELAFDGHFGLSFDWVLSGLIVGYGTAQD
jgi:hypothetical protein